MDVFISYSSKDKKTADEITELLGQNGITYWICSSRINAGDRWAAEITNALSACRVFLVIVSKNSIASTQVPKEVNMALNKKLRIIPFKIDSAPLSGELDYYLSNLHYIQAGFGKNRYDELLGAIKTSLNISDGAVNNVNVTNHVTNNVNNISLKNPVFKVANPVWIIAAVLAVVLAVVLLKPVCSSGQTAESAEDGQGVSSVVFSDGESIPSNASEAADVSKNSAAAFFPKDIMPFQTPDNQNCFSIYSGDSGSFCMGGEEYTSGLTANGKADSAFVFNISGKGYTTLHFKSGHIDGTGALAQYILVYADDEEIFRKKIDPLALSEESDIEISGAKKLTIEIKCPDADFISDASAGLTDVVFYNGAQYTPDFGWSAQKLSYAECPKNIQPYDYISARIYNDSMREDDCFSMGGEVVTSGITADAKSNAVLMFNAADKGFTNLRFVYGSTDGSDNLAQYIIVYADENELFREKIEPGSLPQEANIDISGAQSLKIAFECPDAGFITNAVTGLTDILFYNKNEYTPKTS